MADAGDNKFLWDAKLSALVNWRLYVYDWGMKYLCGGYVGRRFHPFYSVADFLDSIDQRADIAGDIVEKVNGRHD